MFRKLRPIQEVVTTLEGTSDVSPVNKEYYFSQGDGVQDHYRPPSLYPWILSN